MAMWRMEVDAAEEDWTSSSDQPLFAGFKMIMKDPKNWILVVVVYGAASAIAINSFFPTVVASMGRDRITTLLLTSPPYLLACIVCAGVAWNADRVRERYWHTGELFFVLVLVLALVSVLVLGSSSGLVAFSLPARACVRACVYVLAFKADLGCLQLFLWRALCLDSSSRRRRRGSAPATSGR